MPSVVISFSDGEVLHAETPELTFDQQVLEAEPRSVEPNTERALFPLTAIRMMPACSHIPTPKAPKA